MTTSTILANREAYVPRETRQLIKVHAFKNDTTISEEVGRIVTAYAKGELELGDDPGPATDGGVRIRFAVEAKDWRAARARAIEEQTSIATIIRRAIAAL